MAPLRPHPTIMSLMVPLLCSLKRHPIALLSVDMSPWCIAGKGQHVALVSPVMTVPLTSGTPLGESLWRTGEKSRPVWHPGLLSETMNVLSLLGSRLRRLIPASPRAPTLVFRKSRHEKLPGGASAR